MNFNCGVAEKMGKVPLITWPALSKEIVLISLLNGNQSNLTKWNLIWNENKLEIQEEEQMNINDG